MKSNLFNKCLIIGVGLIGSSLARKIKQNKICKKVYGIDTDKNVILKCKELNILLDIKKNVKEFNFQFDLIIICSPLGTYKDIFLTLNNFIKTNTIVTDVGSTKVSVINDFNENCDNKKIKFIPSHPIAGLEKSGPEYGFAKLFENRFCILTPKNKNDENIKKVEYFWQSLGMKTQYMSAEHHDRILAMTSHIPQLIAYSIVSTANDLESNIKDEVLKFSAAGFRDFTRLAGSDPIMWRDVYSKNKDFVLEMLDRFTEDLSALQKAIHNDDLLFLEKTFSSTVKTREIIEDIGQAGSFDPTESGKSK